MVCAETQGFRSLNWDSDVKTSVRHLFLITSTFPLYLSFFSAPSDKDVKKAQALKDEGNALVKKGEHKKAIEKYSQSLKLNPTEVTTYTNR